MSFVRALEICYDENMTKKRFKSQIILKRGKKIYMRKTRKKRINKIAAPLALSLMLAGTSIAVLASGANHEHPCKQTHQTIYTWISGDEHKVFDITYYFCTKDGCDYGSTDSSVSYEGHSYEYNTSSSQWVCVCGDSYSH